MLPIFDVYVARSRAWFERNTFRLTLSVLAFLFMLTFVHKNLFIVILPGQTGAQWSRFGGGTITERVYGEGLHVIFPWNKMYIYDVRYQRQAATYDVLSADGLRIEVEVVARYKLIEDTVGYLHRYVGPEYVETLLIPEVGSFVREQISQYRPDELYSAERLNIQQAIFTKVESDLRIRIPPDEEKDFILLQDVLLRSIKLPDVVVQAIESKLAQEQLMLEYDFVIEREEKERERKKIEGEGIRLFQEMVAEGISERYLRWKGIDATLQMATSPNAKIVVIGAGEDGLPIILGNVDTAAPAPPAGQGGGSPLATPAAPPQATDPTLAPGQGAASRQPGGRAGG